MQRWAFALDMLTVCLQAAASKWMAYKGKQAATSPTNPGQGGLGGLARIAEGAEKFMVEFNTSEDRRVGARFDDAPARDQGVRVVDVDRSQQGECKPHATFADGAGLGSGCSLCTPKACTGCGCPLHRLSRLAEGVGVARGVLRKGRGEGSVAYSMW